MSVSGRRVRDGADPRAAAARAIDRVLRRGETLEASLASCVENDLDPRDRAQASALAFGSLRWHCRHRLIIAELLERPLRDKDKVIESLLSVGLFQLMQARQPDYAVVSSTVEAARRLSRPHLARLVNASLRRFQRERTHFLEQVMRGDEGRYAHPQWLIDKIRVDWPEQWQSILAAALAQPPMWLRVNRSRTSRDDYRARLEAESQLSAQTLRGFDDALRLDHPVAVTELPGFAAGDVSVQDPASQLAVEMLAPEPGMRVLDACAAPGGKTIHMLERTRGDLELVVLDIDAERLNLLQDNLSRSGFSADVKTGDILDADCSGLSGSYDLILLDAPCSASGVIRRHPDIRFLRRPDDLPRFAERQRHMLARLWPLLRPGGRLLYATCSIFREENSAVVDAFLSAQPNACELRPLSGDVLDLALPQPSAGYQLLPADSGTDGFYYALMTCTA